MKIGMKIVMLVTGTCLFYFSIYEGNVVMPIDELIFFRGVAQPPTRFGMPSDGFASTPWLFAINIWGFPRMGVSQKCLANDGKSENPMNMDNFLMNMDDLMIWG